MTTRLRFDAIHSIYAHVNATAEAPRCAEADAEENIYANCFSTSSSALLGASAVVCLRQRPHDFTDNAARSATLQDMRIIAGEFGGRKLLPPQSDATRPITDRAKQSLFDVLAPLISDETLIYDCFSGTGSLGLEALSRGAKFCTFFEQDRPAVARLTQNIASLQVADRSRVVQGDLFRWFSQSTTRPGHTEASGADIVFLDPPYRFLKQHADELLQLALHLAHGHLKADAIIVFRHDLNDQLELPKLERYDAREYGEMHIEFLRVASDEGV